MKKIVWLILILGLVGGGAYWCLKGKNNGNGNGAKAETLVPAPVFRTNIEVTVQSTATVQPQNRLEIKPPIAGRIEEVLVQEGEAVKAGQILAWMSSTDRAALLDAARARGDAELERWKDIYKATPLIAPLDGTIIARSFEPGQTVTAQDALLVMSDVLIVEAQVDETDLARIRLGQGVTVTLDAYPEESFPAKVSHISYEAETVENVTIYKVDVLPDQMPEFVRSGMTANVTFVAESAANVLAVPAEAVKTDGGKPFVQVPSFEPGASEPREVQTGLTDGRNIEIKGGLAEGDLVMVPRAQTATPESEMKTNPFMPFGRSRGTSTRRSSGGPPPPR